MIFFSFKERTTKKFLISAILVYYTKKILVENERTSGF